MKQSTSATRRTGRLLACLVLTLLVSAVCATTAFAATVKIVPSTLWTGTTYEYPDAFEVENFPDNAKVTSVKSSNTKLLKVVSFTSDIEETVLKAVKAGKPKLTIKYKVGSKTYTKSATFTIKAYPKAYQYIKVNGKAIDLTKNKFYYDVNKYTKTTAKIAYKLNSGWSLEYSYGYATNGANAFEPVNNKSFKVPKGKNVEVYFVFKKGSTRLQYCVRFNRK